jgi:hypothetical protein
MTAIPLSNMKSNPSAKFTNIGDSYSGRVVSAIEQQQTHPVTGALQFFESGTPRMVWLITLEQSNGEPVVLWASGGNYRVKSGKGHAMLVAIGDAVEKVGAPGVEIGGELTVTHTGLADTSPAPARLFTAEYRAATPVAIPADLFNS